MIAFDWRCLTAVELSTTIGVGGCGWPISSRASRTGVAPFTLKNRAPSSASDAAATTLHVLDDVGTHVSSTVERR